ncbi:hypothetical protein GGR52DRAFT_534398 [Hypoxylon sp. FL1284]|nr:hypothetical protein GGR52DRAFT_534398 [Hypoxylon sp. FL1284]
MPDFFPPSHPSHTSYAIHSIAEEWPTEMHGQYGLVHQRFTLLGVGRTATPRQAVSYRSALVAPGGWIQLGEVDPRQPSAGGPAMNDMWSIIRATFSAICSTHDFAHGMAEWLVEEGFEDVREEAFEIGLSPRCKDPAVGKRSIDVMLQSWEAMMNAGESEYLYILGCKYC